MRALRFSCRQKYCYYYLDRSSQGTAYAVRSTSHSQPVMWALPGGPGAKIWGNGMPSMSSPCGALVLAPPWQAGVGGVLSAWCQAGFFHEVVRGRYSEMHSGDETTAI